MKLDYCEKLLDAFENAVIMTKFGTDVSISLAEPVRDGLRDVIISIMTNEKKPAYMDGGVVVRDAPLEWPGLTTTPAHVTKPIEITCDCKDEYTERF